jgi:hypothetical protein
MYDLSYSWPYEQMMQDVYFQECPFCGASSILLPFKKEAFEEAKDGVKTHIVMPCCNERLDIVKIDDDYIWSDSPLRKMER